MVWVLADCEPLLGVDVVDVKRGFVPPQHIVGVDGLAFASRTPEKACSVTSMTQCGLPFRLLTNTTTRSRWSLTAGLAEIGLPISEDDLIAATTATAEQLRRVAGTMLSMVAHASLEDFVICCKYSS